MINKDRDKFQLYEIVTGIRPNCINCEHFFDCGIYNLQHLDEGITGMQEEADYPNGVCYNWLKEKC